MRILTIPPFHQKLILLGVILAVMLNGCALEMPDLFVPASPTIPGVATGPTSTPQPSAAITFRVSLPAPLQTGETLFLSVLDEVTGLGLNAVSYTMQSMDAMHFTVAIPFAIGSVIKYRYVRQGTYPVLEDDVFDQPVRYRLFSVTGTGMTEDVVSSWSDALFSADTGRVSGQIVDSSSGSPLTDILISAGGQQTLTDSSGTFTFTNLPVGVHNLVAYSLDGSYQTFQQGARVEAGQHTPVKISMDPAQMVDVTFTVSVPANTIPNAPVRLAGNLYQLGNTFADLEGGMSSVASRMPVLAQQPDGKMSLTLKLPAGADIRYKYTLGDGFWNAEHSLDGSFILRQLIVPAASSPIQIQDAIQTWQAGTYSPILFEVQVPAFTPVTDIISIQFNPYGWTEPIPMWALGNNKWAYQLFSPLNMLSDFGYRYCRNDQCGIADDISTSTGHAGRLVSTSLSPQNLQDNVSAWTWLEQTNPATLTGYPVNARQGFMAGIEFQAGYDPTWQAWIPLAIQNTQAMYANWLVLTPTWTVSRVSPFLFSSVTGQDPLWADTLDAATRAKAANLNVAFFPMQTLPSSSSDWWTATPRDGAWWQAWFERYEAFAIHHADLAERSGAGRLILGGDWVLPALPGGLVEGNPSGVPVDANSRWQAILTKVRAHFSGEVYWAISYRGESPTLPELANSLDGLYLLWYTPLVGADVNEMYANAGGLLDNDVLPLQQATAKPLMLAVAFPSAAGAGSIDLPEEALVLPGNPLVAVDLQYQADAYQALLLATNERSWVSGFISRGYYVPVVLQDGSMSVHGKPGADVLWYWFPRLLGIQQ